jgi:hypothetical protein
VSLSRCLVEPGAVYQPLLAYALGEQAYGERRVFEDPLSEESDQDDAKGLHPA